jgi:2Fe-2S ferredoxin
MLNVHFIRFDGQRHSVQTEEGESLMRAATDNGVPGIDGDCGGQCACGTCHVYVQAPWGERLPATRPSENDMLAFANERRESSRLACQITMTAELDGIEVHMPEGQH